MYIFLKTSTVTISVNFIYQYNLCVSEWPVAELGLNINSGFFCYLHANGTSVFSMRVFSYCKGAVLRGLFKKESLVDRNSDVFCIMQMSECTN